MKKLIAFVLVLITLAIAFASCAEENTPDATTYGYYTSKITPPVATTATETPPAASTAAGTAATTWTNSTTATPAATTATSSTQGGTTPAEVFVPSGYGAILASRYLETKSKILFLVQISTEMTLKSIPLYYYSKADGDFYPFCFNPLCQHDVNDFDRNITCVGCALSSGIAKPSSKADPVFMNSRIYFIYFDSIYSCSEFATDLKLEFSFHEYDHLADSEVLKRYSNKYFPICDFQGYGSSLLFKHIDANGELIQYVFNTKTKKLSSLTDKIDKAGETLGATLYVTGFTDDKIFLEAYKNIINSSLGITGTFYVIGDFVGSYEADYELTELRKIDYTIPPAPIFKTSDGYIYYSYDPEKDSTDVCYLSFDGEKRTLIEDYEKTLGGKNPQLVYVLGDFIYYYTEQPVEMGYDESLHGKMRENWSGGKMYRYDMKTGEIKLLFDDLKYDNFAIYYIGDCDNMVLMTVSKYEKKSATEVKTTGRVLIKAALDANGNFIDLEEVELE